MRGTKRGTSIPRAASRAAISEINDDGLSDHFAGYFKNEKKEKKEKGRKRERITGSQQLTSSSCSTYIRATKVSPTRIRYYIFIPH